MKVFMIVNRQLFSSFLLSFVLAASAFAAEKADLKEILAVVKKGYSAMDDLSATFSQRTYVASIKREEKGSGDLSLRKKGGTAQFHFNYLRPKQQIVSNGKNVWYYLPNNKQVILTDTAKLFSGGNGMALSYLTGLGNLADDFEIKLLTPEPDKKGNYQLELVPKKPNAAVAKLQLYISGTGFERARKSPENEPFFLITSSVLFDHTGNRTTIEYSNVKVNGGIAGDKFNFKPPTGVDIIKQ
jgi:outer membrane lipoprotein carrier protein